MTPTINLKGLTVAAIIALAGASSAVAVPPPENDNAPNFMPAIYADGLLWGTKGTADLPAPNPKNAQSFDALYMITNSNNPGDQLPVAEAAPGNPLYNGGRWAAKTVMWTADGFSEYGIVPILKSLDDIDLNHDLGFLTIMDGTAMPPPAPDYFDCPLLPVLGQ